MKSSRNKKKIYALYSLESTDSWYYSYSINWKWRKVLLTREELINKLAVCSGGKRGILEHLVDDMSKKSGERVEAYVGFTGDKVYHDIPNYYIAKIVNGEFVKADISSMMNEIEERRKVLDKKRESRVERYEYEKKQKNCYEFRNGSVPNIGHKKWHLGDYYRHPKTAKSQRNAYDYELEEYTGKGWDAKAKNLPTLYDDIARHRDKSWKTSYKVRKQWEKHCRKHVDTVVIPADGFDECKELVYEKS